MLKGDDLYFSLTFAYLPLNIKELKFNSPSGLTINGQIINSIIPTVPRMAPYLMQIFLNQDLITSITSEDILVDKD